MKKLLNKCDIGIIVFWKSILAQFPPRYESFWFCNCSKSNMYVDIDQFIFDVKINSLKNYEIF